MPERQPTGMPTAYLLKCSSNEEEESLVNYFIPGQRSTRFFTINKRGEYLKHAATKPKMSDLETTQIPSI